MILNILYAVLSQTAQFIGAILEQYCQSLGIQGQAFPSLDPMLCRTSFQ